MMFYEEKKIKRATDAIGAMLSYCNYKLKYHPGSETVIPD